MYTESPAEPNRTLILQQGADLAHNDLAAPGMPRGRTCKAWCAMRRWMRSSATSTSAVFRVAMACLSTSSRPAAASTSAQVTTEHRHCTLHRILGGATDRRSRSLPRHLHPGFRDCLGAQRR